VALLKKQNKILSLSPDTSSHIVHLEFIKKGGKILPMGYKKNYVVPMDCIHMFGGRIKKRSITLGALSNLDQRAK
jgi:hypothetical protein